MKELALLFLQTPASPGDIVAFDVALGKGDEDWEPLHTTFCC